MYVSSCVDVDAPAHLHRQWRGACDLQLAFRGLTMTRYRLIIRTHVPTKIICQGCFENLSSDAVYIYTSTCSSSPRRDVKKPISSFDSELVGCMLLIFSLFCFLRKIPSSELLPRNDWYVTRRRVSRAAILSYYRTMSLEQPRRSRAVYMRDNATFSRKYIYARLI